MSSKSFLALAAVTLVAVVLAIVTTSMSDVGNAIAERGKPFLPELIDEAKNVSEISTVVGDETMTVRKAEDGFVSASGYPAKAKVVRALVNNLALMTIEERKTADPERHEDLDLAPTTAKTGWGERITLKDASGREIADIIAGERDFTVGGTRGAQFMRRAASDQTYLVRGSVSIPSSRSGWFDTNLATVKADDVQRITTSKAGSPAIEISRDGNTLALVNVPDGKSPDADKVKRIARVFSPLTFVDVRKSNTDETPEGTKLVMQTKAGLVLTLQAFKAADASSGATPQSWVRATASTAKDEAKAQAKALNAKLSGYDFKLSTGDIEAMNRTVGELVAEPKS